MIQLEKKILNRVMEMMRREMEGMRSRLASYEAGGRLEGEAVEDCTAGTIGRGSFQLSAKC